MGTSKRREWHLRDSAANGRSRIAPLGVANFGDWPTRYSFRSRHPSGLHFALADGSVRFVANNIPLLIYRQMATRAGGETANTD